jgi:hypothetical protein
MLASSAVPSRESSAGSDRPDDTLAGLLTSPRSCRLRTTMFIACGETLTSRASSAFDRPGECDRIRMQTYCGNDRPIGSSTAAVTSVRSAVATLVNR